LREFLVQFFTRPGCHLCDEARPVVEAVVRGAGGRVEEIDIETADRLVGLYGLRVPVVSGSDGEVLAEGIIDGRDLKKRLARFLRSTGPNAK
jgi:thiol-disulfide isomerase/thioredoxin